MLRQHILQIVLTGCVSLFCSSVVASDPAISESELFGPNVYIFSPDDSREKITSTIKEITDDHVDGRRAQFTSKRAAIFFKPGDYSWLSFENGFYMQVAGLGKTPLETKLNRVFVQTDWLGSNNATCNFWRVIENLSLLNSDESPFYYGVSQAAPLRRMSIDGKVQFDNRAGWASGGYMADSVVNGTAGSPSQQQFFLRNNKTPFTGVNWNLVAVGNIGDVGDRENRSIVPETPVVYEKPFLYFENSQYYVFVPERRENSQGPSWTESEIGPGKSIPLSEFHVARADRDTAETMNKALEEGKHLLLTPGTYELSEPLEITRENAVVLGIGLASLQPTNGNNAVNVADVGGVRLAGFFLDAGSGENSQTATGGSEVLLRVGTKGSKIDLSKNPIVLSDLFFRVGGVRTENPCRADISLEINASSTIGDHFWIWRADHGGQVGWDKNKADYGLIVNGDDVVIYGLFVEHYQKYDTLWTGENGRMYFYQNEKAYDVPYQEDWIGPDGSGNGWASYRIADHVKKHEAWGLGMYSVFINTKGFVLMENAIVAPRSGDITIYNPMITLLSTKGGIEHIINDVGGPLTNKESNRGSQQRLPKSYNNVWKSARP